MKIFHMTFSLVHLFVRIKKCGCLDHENVSHEKFPNYGIYVYYLLYTTFSNIVYAVCTN